MCIHIVQGGAGIRQLKQAQPYPSSMDKAVGGCAGRIYCHKPCTSHTSRNSPSPRDSCIMSSLQGASPHPWQRSIHTAHSYSNTEAPAVGNSCAFVIHMLVTAAQHTTTYVLPRPYAKPSWAGAGWQACSTGTFPAAAQPHAPHPWRDPQSHSRRSEHGLLQRGATASCQELPGAPTRI